MPIILILHSKRLNLIKCQRREAVRGGPEGINISAEPLVQKGTGRWGNEGQAKESLSTADDCENTQKIGSCIMK